MLAAIAVPEQLATARLAGMPPQTGLYAFIAGSLAFAAFGVNRYLSAGADSTIAPIFAGSLAALATSGSAEYAGLVGFVALVSVALLLAAGLLRAGWLADLLSFPVTVGFLAGISVHIIAGQLPAFLGIASPSGPLLVRLTAIAAHVAHANGYAVALGVTTLVITVAAERIGPRVPGALLGLAVAGTVASAARWSAHGVAMLDPLPARLPHFGFPPLADAATWAHALPVAAIVALVCSMQTAATARSFPPSESGAENVARDFAAIGLGSICAAIAGSFAVDASPPRTAVVATSGGRSQAAGLTAIAVIAALLLFGASLPAHLPQAALAGILIFIGIRIFRRRDMLDIARRGGFEIWLVAASALLVIALPIETGMFLSIALSLGQGLYIVARPPSAQLLRVPGTTIWWPPIPGDPGERVSGVLVFAPGAPLSFTNAGYVVERLRAAIAAAPEPVRTLVIECEGVLDVDYTGSLALQRAIAGLRAQGMEICLARLEDPRAQAAAARSGLIAALGPGRVFKSVYEALIALGTLRS